VRSGQLLQFGHRRGGRLQFQLRGEALLGDVHAQLVEQSGLVAYGWDVDAGERGGPAPQVESFPERGGGLLEFAAAQRPPSSGGEGCKTVGVHRFGCHLQEVAAGSGAKGHTAIEPAQLLA
jgi:hypothetical protein